MIHNPKAVTPPRATPDAEGTQPVPTAPAVLAPEPPPFTPPVPPTARMILRHHPASSSASRQAWHAARARGIGGSEILAVLGLNPYCSPYKLWMIKTGRLAPEPPRGRMRWGIMMEPVVREWFTLETGIRVLPTGTWAHHRPLVPGDGPGPRLALCNPDGFCEDGAGLEIKTLHPHAPDTKLWKAGEVPDYPEAQANWCMYVTGFRRWWMAGQIDGAEAPIIREVTRNQALINELVPAAAEFLTEYVLPDVAPPVDGHPSTAAALNAAAVVTGTAGERELGGELEDLLARRRQIKKTIKGLDADLSLVENEIKHRLDGHTYGTVNGVPRVQYVRRSRSAYSVTAGEYMELREVKSRG